MDNQDKIIEETFPSNYRIYGMTLEEVRKLLELIDKIKFEEKDGNNEINRV